MSNNRSNQPGWLTPLDSDPVYDEDLDRLLGRWLRNVTGYPDDNVRSRWQSDIPSLMAVETDWCAFGVVDVPVDGSPVFAVQTGDSAQLWRHEILTCRASFYGAAGMRYASRFRDGICVPQNNAELNHYGLSLLDYSSITPFPELINQQWVRRHDLTLRLRRKVVRKYGIESLVEAPVHFFGE